MSLQIDSFPLLTIVFFTTNRLRNEHLQIRKENVKRRFDKHMGKELAQGPTLKEQECKFQKQLSFYLSLHFGRSSPTEEP